MEIPKWKKDVFTVSGSPSGICDVNRNEIKLSTSPKYLRFIKAVTRDVATSLALRDFADSSSDWMPKAVASEEINCLPDYNMVSRRVTTKSELLGKD